MATALTNPFEVLHDEGEVSGGEEAEEEVGLWASLPDDLVVKIIKYTLEDWTLLSGGGRSSRTRSLNKLLRLRTLNRVFAQAFHTMALCQVPLHFLNHAACFIEGVVRQAAKAVRNAGPGMTTDMYSYLYTVVYFGCTGKAPNNMSGPYYEQLEKLGVVLERVLGAQAVFTEGEKQGFKGLVTSIFRYLDRFYVQRFYYKSVPDLVDNSWGYLELVRNKGSYPGRVYRDLAPSTIGSVFDLVKREALKEACSGRYIPSEKYELQRAATRTCKHWGAVNKVHRAVAQQVGDSCDFGMGFV